METPSCFFCKTTENVDYCKICKKHMCKKCMKKFNQRFLAMLKEKYNDVKSVVMKKGDYPN